MKVKIGDVIFDANEQPVMLIFESDMQRISVGQHLINMPDGGRKYCMYPDYTSREKIENFMKIE